MFLKYHTACSYLICDVLLVSIPLFFFLTERAAYLTDLIHSAFHFCQFRALHRRPLMTRLTSSAFLEVHVLQCQHWLSGTFNAEFALFMRLL